MPRTTESWATYRESIGDRSSLFASLVERWQISQALYPGCYLDLSPSTVIDAVTYVDVDKRAAKHFEIPAHVASDLGASRASRAQVEFLHLDYTAPLPVEPRSFDLLISLYAGPVWEHCRQYLSPDGLLLANSSHGDASLAALDSGLELVGVVRQRDGRYRVDIENLDSYLIPKDPAKADAEQIRRNGRGVAYTKPAFAYLFRAVTSGESR